MAYAGGPAGLVVGQPSSARVAQDVSHGLSDVEVVNLGHFAPVFAGGVAAADLVAASRATTISHTSDLVALGILNRLQARGLRVPEDVSVVGYDAGIPAATLVLPRPHHGDRTARAAGPRGGDLLVAHGLRAGRQSAAERALAEDPHGGDGPVRRAGRTVRHGRRAAEAR